MKQRVFLVVGLGNPEEKYFDTFHNVGFRAVERFAEAIDAPFCKGECRALTAHKKTELGKTVIAKPITYMNLSGESVRELVNKYKIEQTDCIVIYDDADLPVGKIRIRKDGSGGSHNGMLNIIKNMGTQNVYRIRIGIYSKFCNRTVLSCRTKLTRVVFDKVICISGGCPLVICLTNTDSNPR